MQNIRIAAAVVRCPVGEIESNLARTAHWVERARQADAELICFPEMNITGYTNRIELLACAQALPGPVGDRLSELAQKSRIIILAGLAETGPAGQAYATHCVFWPDGRMAHYRKLHLAPNETARLTPGHTIPVFRFPKATFGIQLCYDAHFPELSTAMTARGAHILFMPHASPRGDAASKHNSWMRHLTARAYDNGVFVVACNQAGSNALGLTFPGNAVVLDPSGTVIAKQVAGEEGLLVVDLKASDLEAVRSHPMRHFFPNRRPELYR